MKPHHLSIALCIGFIIAIFLLQWFQEAHYPPDIWILLGCLGVIGCFGCLVRETRRTGSIALAGALGLFLAFHAVSRTTHVPSPETVDWYADGNRATIHGTVADQPDKRPLKTKYTIAVDEVNGIPVSGLVLVTDNDQFPEYRYGDEVIVQGKLEKPGLIVDSTGSPQADFHYDRYLSRYGIYSVMYRANIQPNTWEANFLREMQHKTALNRPFSPLKKFASQVFGKLYSLKSRFEHQINRIYPEPHASFLAGLLTGSRRGIPEHLLEDFNRTGLTHIIAISGYNITIVFSLITVFLFWLPLKTRFIPGVVVVILFTVLVGAEASVVRAAIMGILGLLALQTGRQRHARLAVLWTLFIMLLWNPKYLWHDAGFQLSFLAVIGLIELSPILKQWLAGVPETFSIREALQMTIAAQLTAVPWIIHLFGRMSLTAPLANVFVALPVPLAMAFGFAGVTASFLWFPLGQLIAYFGWGFLEFVIKVAQTLSHIPFGTIPIPSFGIGTMVMYYVALIALTLTIRKHILSSEKLRELKKVSSPEIGT